MTSAPARLLIAYDGSETATDAVRAAAQLFPHAPVSVAYVPRPSTGAEQAALAGVALPDTVVGAAREHDRALRARTEQLVERGRLIAEREGLHATGEFGQATTPWRALVDAARQSGADLIVCGSRGRGPFSRSLLGSTSSSLLYHADRSVLIVPPGGGALDGPTLIGYDASDGAREAVDAAARLLPGRPAIVAHAWATTLELSYAGQPVELVPSAEAEEALAARSAEVADEGAARARDAGLDARPMAVAALAGTWRALAAAARAEGAAVTVVGHRGRGALASAMLGSVSAGLAHNAELPVLVVR